MATEPLMTAEEFLGWVDHPENADARWELVRGEPVDLPPWPAGCDAFHLHVARLLSDYVIRRGAGEVAFLNDGLITSRNPDTVRHPAVMVFLAPARRDDFPPRFTSEVPQLIVDLSPPGDSFSRFTRRMVDYVTFGAPLIWGVWPDEQCVIISRPKRPPYVLELDDELAGTDSLPDLRLRVRDLLNMSNTPTV